MDCIITYYKHSGEKKEFKKPGASNSPEMNEYWKYKGKQLGYDSMVVDEITTRICSIENFDVSKYEEYLKSISHIELEAIRN
jgi:hypothetical protein